MEISISNDTSYPDECIIARTFFYGQCFGCNDPGSRQHSKKRCGGCQLVTYCSKECQKDHWNTHKYVCKEFPVVNGKNALHTTGSWEEHISCLRDRGARLPPVLLRANFLAKGKLILCSDNAKLTLSNPRVCHTCHEASPNLLTDCDCASVTYCSKICAETDKPHKKACRLMAQIAQSYIQSDSGDFPLQLDIQVKEATLTLYHVLNSDWKTFGCKTLTIHIVTSSPLVYQEPWENFMHMFPNLTKLNLVFVMQANAFKSKVNFNFKLSGLSLISCDDCEENNRIITYSVQQMLYHMFFSSPQYTEPDAVVVFGNTYEMSLSDKDDINTNISYRNMTHSQDTILVLTDETEDLVRQGSKAVNSAQPIDELEPPMKNPFLKELDGVELSNKSYFTCLKRSPTHSEPRRGNNQVLNFF